MNSVETGYLIVAIMIWSFSVPVGMWLLISIIAEIIAPTTGVPFDSNPLPPPPREDD